MALAGARRDLRGARRVLVDQHRQRYGEGAPVAGDFLHLFLPAAPDQDGAGPGAKELADDAARRVDVAARGVAQVEQHHRDRALQVGLQRLVEIGRRLRPEVEAPDIRHAVVEDMHADARDVDFRAGQVEGERLAVPADLQLDLRVGLPPEVIDGLVRRPALGALPIDRGDGVTGLDAGLFSRRVRQHAGDHDLVAFLLDGGADAGELTGEETLVRAVFARFRGTGELVAQRPPYPGGG